MMNNPVKDIVVLGMSLSPTINDINNLSERNFYGIWCSYVVSILLFYVMVKETDLVVKRESYVLRIIELIKKLDIKLKEVKRNKNKRKFEEDLK